MKIGRTALTVFVAGCALSASAMADQPVLITKKAVASPAPAAANVLPTFRILPNGERVAITHNPNAPRPRGGVIGFNNQDCEPCSTGLNVAYNTPGGYDGSDPSGQAFIFGLGDGPAGSPLRAPSAPPDVPNPTHIIWNDYFGDPDVWPGGEESEAAVVEYSFVTSRNNVAGTVDRTDGYRILFFTDDGLEFKGGFEFTIVTPAGQGFYQQVIIDLADFDPPLFIPISGLMMVDCPPPEEGAPAIGVGLAFAGGDLANPDFPTPESLVAVGFTDATAWLFADGETGFDGPGSEVDPLFDGEEGVSYLDVLNTGFLVDWQFGDAAGIFTLAHDFPARMSMTDGTTTIGACVILSGQFCFETDEADCLLQEGIYNGDGTTCGENVGACCVEGACQEVLPSVCTAMGGTYQGDFSTCGETNCDEPKTCPCDFNDSGTLNSQDFFDFLAAFFESAPAGDFNDDGEINSQDFFDFLSCFFQPPAGC